MFEAILFGLIAFFALIVAARVLCAIVVIGWMILAGLFRAVGLVIFGIARVIFEILALPFRLVAVLLRPLIPAGAVAEASGIVLGSSCRNQTCRCANPVQARFCRRCGAALASGQGVMV